MKFKELELREELLQSIGEMGFETPTPVQEKAIPIILNSNHDLKALAQTGTGKTAAFGLPLIEMLDEQVNSVQAIVLCPTRELCLQITRDLKDYAKYMPEVGITAVYGGADISRQIKKLKSNTVDIVVGTPGRVQDLINRRALKLGNIKWLVLDEADEMLTMGFKDELEGILSSTPDSRRTFLFSATMPKSIEQLANQYMHDDVLIKVEGSNRGVENITHIYHMVHERDRYPALKRVVDLVPDVYGIVFCRTRQDCKNVADKLMQDGYNADALHGDLSQAQRDYVMKRFREKQLQLLVATDVAARGIDVNDLTHVINYNLPDEAETYIHRSGRTGRAGKNGVSVSIINMRERGKLRNVEKAAKVGFEQLPVPDGMEICERQLMHFMDKIQSVEVNAAQIGKYLPAIYDKLQHLNREELIQHFVTAEFNRFLSYYQNAEDINVSNDERQSSRRSSNADFVRLFINCGKNHRLDALGLIKLVNRTTRDKVDIGKIDIQRNFSFFEVDSGFSKQIVGKLNKMKFEGMPLEVGVAEGVEKKRSRGKRKNKQDKGNDNYYAKRNANKRGRKKSKRKKR